MFIEQFITNICQLEKKAGIVFCLKIEFIKFCCRKTEVNMSEVLLNSEFFPEVISRDLSF